MDDTEHGLPTDETYTPPEVLRALEDAGQPGPGQRIDAAGTDA